MAKMAMSKDADRYERIAAMRANPPAVMTQKDVACVVGVSDRTVRSWISCGALVSHKVGPANARSVRVLRDDLMAFLKADEGRENVEPGE